MIRTIQPSDNPVLAMIIRSALTEFGANKPGTVPDVPDGTYFIAYVFLPT